LTQPGKPVGVIADFMLPAGDGGGGPAMLAGLPSNFSIRRRSTVRNVLLLFLPTVRDDCDVDTAVISTAKMSLWVFTIEVSLELLI
jgi:hypothetical protein